MGIKSRLEESAFLFEKGRYYGALLLVLSAVSATSRKRYPRSKNGLNDCDAFETFIKDELPDMTLAMTGGAICVYGDFLYDFRGKQLKIENVLYKYVRCGLMHEGKCSEVEFPESYGWDSGSSGNTIKLSTHWIVGLWQIVRYAIENTSEFIDGDPCMTIQVGMSLPEAKLRRQQTNM